MKRLSLSVCALIVAISALFSGPAVAAEPVGRIESASGELWAMRGDRRVSLAAGSDIYEYDIINTGESGSAQAGFADGSVLQLGGGTSVNVMEAVFSAERNRFNVGITSGLARVITGEIAKINPNGFKITTPRSVIGIRGTTLSFSVSEAHERVTLEDLGQGSVV
ncbi:MAG: FecR family protein, partial [Synergistaceae bacterium]|nr:FecR family protein [Synergistaceae bacterium]